MGISFSITAADRTLQNMIQAVGTPAPLLKAFGVLGLREVALNFENEGRPSWQALAPSTVAAKREGRGTGRGEKALSGLRNTFDFEVGEREVVLFSPKDGPNITKFHEFGTKGPYTIAAKPGKFLALPFFAPRDMPRGVKGHTGKETNGRFSLRGLGRSFRTFSPAGRPETFIFQPQPGRRVPTHLKGREFRKVVPTTNIAFYRSVQHPGVVARPMMPDPDILLPKLRAAAILFVRKKVGQETP